MNPFSSYISVDTLTSDATLAEALALPPPPSQSAGPLGHAPTLPPSMDEWTGNFVRSLQSQHARIREFLDARRDRWRQIAGRFTLQIEKLQAEVHALTAANEDLCASVVGQPESAPSEEASARYLAAMEEIRDLKARNAELQRQLLAGQGAAGRIGELAVTSERGDWESQKRRLIADLESSAGRDGQSIEERLKIEEIIARTDKIIAEKNREIEELQHLLNHQSESIGSLALGAAAFEQVFDQDEIIREERARLQQVQEELREKLRHAEIEHAMERARLARKEAELEERLRGGESRRAAAESDAEALAHTGRPVRGRWRTQMGLTDDDIPDFDRGRR